jgi:hypothetical protein
MPEPPDYDSPDSNDSLSSNENPQQYRERIKKETARLEEEQIKIDNKQLSISNRQFYAGVFFNLVLALSSVVLAKLTYDLSESTKLLRIYSGDQIRPYVFPTLISKNSETNETFVTIKNIGLTPAYNVNFNGEIFVRDIVDGKLNIGVDFSSDCSPNPNVKSPALPTNLGSNESQTEYVVPVEEPPITTEEVNINPKFLDNFSDKQIKNVATGKSVFVVIGIICYNNLHKEQYYTKYCKFFATSSFYGTIKGTKSDELYENEGARCPLHNDAD